LKRSKITLHSETGGIILEHPNFLKTVNKISTYEAQSRI